MTALHGDISRVKLQDANSDSHVLQHTHLKNGASVSDSEGRHLVGMQIWLLLHCTTRSSRSVRFRMQGQTMAELGANSVPLALQSDAPRTVGDPVSGSKG